MKILKNSKVNVVIISGADLLDMSLFYFILFYVIFYDIVLVAISDIATVVS